MRGEVKPRESSMGSMLSGWMRQGMDTFFATQRILVDLAMRQNASVMNLIREQFSNPRHSPVGVLTELAGEGMSNFIAAQNVLLNLAQQQNEIVMTGVKERVGDSTAALAMTDLVRRGVDTFIDMQHEYLKIAGKQTHAWLDAVKTGKPFKGERLVEVARDGMENFIRAQKKFLDAVAEEMTRVTSGKHVDGARKTKKTELVELARQATDAYIDAQKKLSDLAGQQMHMNLKAASKTMELVKPFPFVPLSDMTREGVKSFVDAQKALMDVMLKPKTAAKHEAKTARRGKRPVRAARGEAQAAHVVA
jgi:hypothetical protein